LDRSRRFGKDGLSEYLCMYIPVVVSSGSSVRILYPRVYFFFLGRSRRFGKDGLSEYHGVAPLGFYILGNLLIPGKIPKVR
jgi:hypothetical protein